MIIKFFEKWSVALVFAVLLHTGVFLILYTNHYESSIDNVDYSQKSTEDLIISTSIVSDHPPAFAQAHISTSNTLETVNNIDNNQDRYIVLNDNSIVRSNEKNANNSLKSVDTSTTYPMEKETISNQKLHDSNNEIAVNQIISIETNSFLNNNLDNIKDDIGLLDIDTPIIKSKPQIDRNYDLIKAEIGETNNQLSNAINEIKKRNQQKIDEIKQQNEYIHNIENNDLAIK